MTRIVEFIKKHQYILYSLFLSFIILLITSKNSFLYPLNDWVDANAFFTVGKSLMNGVVPYRDVFEQKGILLYFIYGIGYLISNKTFHGVFLIEVLFFAVFLYYLHKIITLFLDKKYSYIILPILGFLITTSFSFTHGGAAEEFCFPMFAVTLYYFLRHFQGKEVTRNEFMLNGFLAGCIFLIKYTLLGFWFSFMAFLFFDLIKKKEYKKSFTSCIWFLLGMFAPILVSLGYFFITHSLKDFIECYFTVNMTAYNVTDMPMIEKVIKIYEGTVGSLLNNGLLIFFSILLLPLFVTNLKISRFGKFSLVGMSLITALGLFWGMHFYRYYMMPMFIFIILAFISVCLYCKKVLDKILNKKYSCVLYVGVFLIFTLLSFMNANYKDMILIRKDEMFQFKYAEYISQFDHPTLLNMGYLDGGLYTTTGIVPNTRFFEVQNIPYSKFPDNLDDMKDNVIHKRIDFILYYTSDSLDYIKEHDGYIFENYELVYDDIYYCEHEEYRAFLFQLKKDEL